MKKYQLQMALYLKLSLGDNMATSYNSDLLERIWTLNIAQLKKALK